MGVIHIYNTVILNNAYIYMHTSINNHHHDLLTNSTKKRTVSCNKAKQTVEQPHNFAEGQWVDVVTSGGRVSLSCIVPSTTRGCCYFRTVAIRKLSKLKTVVVNIYLSMGKNRKDLQVLDGSLPQEELRIIRKRSTA